MILWVHLSLFAVACLSLPLFSFVISRTNLLVSLFKINRVTIHGQGTIVGKGCGFFVRAVDHGFDLWSTQQCFRCKINFDWKKDFFFVPVHGKLQRARLVVFVDGGNGPFQKSHS